MNRDLVKFMNSANSQKNNNNNIHNINLKDTSIYNIRRSDNGLYFNLKILGDPEKEIQDLFIPARFYVQNTAAIENKRKLIVINKAKFVEYFLIYPGAIVSLGVIIATILKYLPELQRFFNFPLI